LDLSSTRISPHGGSGMPGRHANQTRLLREDRRTLRWKMDEREAAIQRIEIPGLAANFCEIGRASCGKLSAGSRNDQAGTGGKGNENTVTGHLNIILRSARPEAAILI
jgi:hypothetical protein